MFSKLKKHLTSELPNPPAPIYTLGSIINLYEFKSGAPPKEAGVASLSLKDNHLHVHGVFFDSDLFNKATSDNQETWLLGDVFEFMIQPLGHEDYYEIHSTPNGKKLQLHIPNYRTIRQIPHEEKICDCGLIVNNSYDSTEKIWYSELIVSLESLQLTPEILENSRCVFVRQNHWQDCATPEISASTTFPITAHTPDLWHIIKKR